jgi:hypothetical protein
VDFLLSFTQDIDASTEAANIFDGEVYSKEYGYKWSQSIN